MKHVSVMSCRVGFLAHAYPTDCNAALQVERWYSRWLRLYGSVRVTQDKVRESL